MADSAELQASARIALSDPSAMLGRLCDHFTEHATVTRRERGARLDGLFGSVELGIDQSALTVSVACANETYLFVVKSSLAEHLFEFAEGETFAVEWQGDAAAQAKIPYFREVVVREAYDITPAMRRVIVACEDTAHFDGGDLHVRVLISPPGRSPIWPKVGPDSRVIWPEGEDELVKRVYTIRSVDHARKEMAIDVVLHEGSPGSVWARNARTGDRVGLLGPGGGAAAPADHYLLCGDETALPAIARIAESLPSTVQATLMIEVADRGEEQEIVSAAKLDIVWLHRNGAPAGSTDLLPEAVRAFAPPQSGSFYVFAGCEQAAARAIRKHLRSEWKLPKERHLVAAYWRRGQSDVHDHGE